MTDASIKAQLKKESKNNANGVVLEYLHVRSPPIDGPTQELINAFRKELEEVEDYKADPEIRAFCDDRCLFRYLRARGRKLPKAKEMITKVLQWRRTKRPQDIRARDIEVETCTGKTRITGFDRHGRPVMVMDGSVENSKDYEGQMKHLAWNFERNTRLMEVHDVEKYVLFVHLEKHSLRNSPPLKACKETLEMMSIRHPERLGHCVAFQASAMFSVLWKAIKPFIDPVTLSKIVFIRGDTKEGSQNDLTLKNIIGPNWRDLADVGKPVVAPGCSPGYDHATYWPKVLEEERVWLEQKEKKMSTGAVNGVEDVKEEGDAGEGGAQGAPKIEEPSANTSTKENQDSPPAATITTTNPSTTPSAPSEAS